MIQLQVAIFRVRAQPVKLGMVHNMMWVNVGGLHGDRWRVAWVLVVHDRDVTRVVLVVLSWDDLDADLSRLLW